MKHRIFARIAPAILVAAITIGGSAAALQSTTHEAKAYSIFTCRWFGERGLLAQPAGTFNLVRWSCQRTYAVYGIPFPY